MKQAYLRPQFVEFIPEILEEGILYISRPYSTAAHKCCCGCGNEVITPLSPTDWSMKVDCDQVTLHPSIGNWGFQCRSHYWIRNGRVFWAATMTKQQIEKGRARDRAAKKAYFGKGVQLEAGVASASTPRDASDLRHQAKQSIWTLLKQWWNS